jgi:hypothetical protein
VLSCGGNSSTIGSGADAGPDAEMGSSDARNDVTVSDTASETTVFDSGNDANHHGVAGTDAAQTDAVVDRGADTGPTGQADTGTDAAPEAGGDSSGTDAASNALGDAGVPICVDNTTMCAGLQPLVCSVGVWMNNGDVCASGCTAGTCTCNVGNATKCQGLQPLICQNGFWVNNGGVCGYACAAGACNCNDPRFTPGSDGNSVFDSVTGETWYLVQNGGDYPGAQSVCASSYAGGRLPHESELVGILAQQANNVLCVAWNIDADIDFSQLSPDWYWTDTPPMGASLDGGPGGGPEDLDVVNLQTGAGGIRLADGFNALTICISP